MKKSIIYGIVFHGSSEIEYIGCTRGGLTNLKNTFKYGEKPSPDGEKYRVWNKIREKGIHSFTIRILDILEDADDISMFGQRDARILEFNPELNKFTPLSREDACRISERRESRRKRLDIFSPNGMLKGKALFKRMETEKKDVPLGVAISQRKRSLSCPPSNKQRSLFRISEIEENYFPKRSENV